MHLFSLVQPTISVSARRDMTAAYFFILGGLVVNDKRIGFERIVGAEHIVGVERVEGSVFAEMVYLVATARVDRYDADGLAAHDGAAALLLLFTRDA